MATNSPENEKKKEKEIIILLSVGDAFNSLLSF